MKNELILPQMYANFKAITGLAEIANLSFQTGHDRVAIEQLDLLVKYRKQLYFCDTTKVTNPALKTRIDALVDSDMHKNYNAFNAAVNYLIETHRGSKVQMSPSVSELLSARGFMLDESQDVPSQLKDIAAWFAATGCKQFNESQGNFI